MTITRQLLLAAGLFSKCKWHYYPRSRTTQKMAPIKGPSFLVVPVVTEVATMFPASMRASILLAGRDRITQALPVPSDDPPVLTVPVPPHSLSG